MGCVGTADNNISWTLLSRAYSPQMNFIWVPAHTALDERRANQSQPSTLWTRIFDKEDPLGGERDAEKSRFAVASK